MKTFYEQTYCHNLALNVMIYVQKNSDIDLAGKNQIQQLRIHIITRLRHKPRTLHPVTGFMSFGGLVYTNYDNCS